MASLSLPPARTVSTGFGRPQMSGALNMTPSEIEHQIAKLQSAKDQDEEDAWQVLKTLGADVCPYLVAAYPKFKKWQGRVSLVFHSISYARVREEAFQLGLLALNDRSSIVRYRACSVLAYSLRSDALPPLNALLTHEDNKTREDASAAIAAIQAGNHHLFVDRSRTGRSFWVVNEEDRNYR
jgi:hypothetical protein